jgi:miniconductance mechanosensitive channel
VTIKMLPEWVNEFVLTALLLVISAVAYRLMLRVTRGAVRRAASHTTATWDDRIIERKVLARLVVVLPALLLFYGIGPALGLSEANSDAMPTLWTFGLLVQRVALSTVVIGTVTAATALLEAINDIYQDHFAEAKSRPIKGYLQVLGIALYAAAGVIVVSILGDRSPVVFLSGLGALTALLMLVFRDTILSLVASIQIMSNDMIRIGDWVEMPQANANGDVIDIALHTVKIQNWDMTISTIPTHRFISESFKNWRGMNESGGRRIKRSLHIDLASIHFLSEGEIAHLSRYELLREYMREKAQHLEEYEGRAVPDDVIPEPKRLTNIGTFRAYVEEYLRASPTVHEGMTLLVRQLSPTPQGLPIEIYCFTRDTDWDKYEGVQGDIFDHLIAILPEFGLKVFQEPAGVDLAQAFATGRARDKNASG